MNQIDRTPRLWFPANFTIDHRKAILKDLEEGPWTLSRTEWEWALKGFGLLHNAQAETPNGWRRFAFLYETQIEAVFADRYLVDLLALHDVKAESIPLWARYARAISAWWHRTGQNRRFGRDGQLLLGYLLFWWRAFATGYAFEVQVFRDLTASKIAFTAHNIRSQIERYSSYDLEVLGLYGDIKTSLYFLRFGRSPGMRHDFYISRLRQRKRVRIMVVLMEPAAWKQINGDAKRMTWAEIRASAPTVASVLHEGYEIILIAYEEWKIRVRREQQKGRLG